MTAPTIKPPTVDEAARAMLAALKAICEAMALGPLDAAAIYGPDFDLNDCQTRALGKGLSAIAAAEAAGIKVTP